MSSHIILALYLRKKLIHLSSSMKVTWSILSICYSLSYLKCCWVKQDSGVRIQLLKKKTQRQLGSVLYSKMSSLHYRKTRGRIFSQVNLIYTTKT